jgi:hypothetical protein
LDLEQLMGKRDRNLQQVEVYKNRFRKLSTEDIRRRLGESSLIKEAGTALRRILKERQEQWPVDESNNT